MNVETMSDGDLMVAMDRAHRESWHASLQLDRTPVGGPAYQRLIETMARNDARWHVANEEWERRREAAGLCVACDEPRVEGMRWCRGDARLMGVLDYQPTREIAVNG